MRLRAIDGRPARSTVAVLASCSSYRQSPSVPADVEHEEVRQHPDHQQQVGQLQSLLADPVAEPEPAQQHAEEQAEGRAQDQAEPGPGRLQAGAEQQFATTGPGRDDGSDLQRTEAGRRRKRAVRGAPAWPLAGSDRRRLDEHRQPLRIIRIACQFRVFAGGDPLRDHQLAEAPGHRDGHPDQVDAAVACQRLLAQRCLQPVVGRQQLPSTRSSQGPWRRSSGRRFSS